jgi:hypothetical protein
LGILVIENRKPKIVNIFSLSKLATTTKIFIYFIYLFIYLFLFL